MPTENPRLSFMVTHEMKDRITDYQFEHKCKNTSQALVELIQRGLEIMGIVEAPKPIPMGTELTQDEATLISCYRQLNDDGQRSLLAQAKMHTMNEDYLKDTQRKMA